MLSNYERGIATIIVEALVEYGLNEHLEQYGEYSAHDWFCDNKMGAIGFHVRGGATKLCIEHEDLCDWVIKVGYSRGVKLDYAALEYENYCHACDEGFERYFPETVYLGEFGGRAFYLQEYADCNETHVSSEWYNRIRDSYEEDGEEYSEDQIWDDLDCMDDDQKAFLSFRDSALCNFLYNHNITDLHEGNFGYIGDHMVIVDFSGYQG